MTELITFISPPTAALNLFRIEEWRRAIDRLGGHTEELSILSGSKDKSLYVIDYLINDIVAQEALAEAQRFLATKPVDIISHTTQDREKKLLIADMDSTIIQGETLDELADFAGLKSHIETITQKAMNGEIDFMTALNERVALLSGLPEETLEKTWEKISFMPGAKVLLSFMKKKGAFSVLISGGFDYFTTRVQQACGFDREFSNRLEIIDGLLTGKVIPPIIDRQAKLHTLLTIAKEREIPLSQTMAVGDGANDLDMIMKAGLGVAFHAKPYVASQTKVSIQHNDLTALLYLQGYCEEEIRCEIPQ
jgi:phosphoserine phosphatase